GDPGGHRDGTDGLRRGRGETGALADRPDRTDGHAHRTHPGPGALDDPGDLAVLFVVDNYDSFTYNLVQYLGELGAELHVERNDAVDTEGVAALRPERIVISPGPGTPDDAGVSLDLIRRLGEHTPILGVCLGHQAIGHAFGGTVARAKAQMHGKTSD